MQLFGISLWCCGGRCADGLLSPTSIGSILRKSRKRGGRPQIDGELRTLIRRMSQENPLWGVPRIHGDLLNLGFDLAQSSVAKSMVKGRG